MRRRQFIQSGVAAMGVGLTPLSVVEVEPTDRNQYYVMLLLRGEDGESETIDQPVLANSRVDAVRRVLDTVETGDRDVMHISLRES